MYQDFSCCSKPPVRIVVGCPTDSATRWSTRSPASAAIDQAIAAPQSWPTTCARWTPRCAITPARRPPAAASCRRLPPWACLTCRIRAGRATITLNPASTNDGTSCRPQPGYSVSRLPIGWWKRAAHWSEETSDECSARSGHSCGTRAYGGRSVRRVLLYKLGGPRAAAWRIRWSRSETFVARGRPRRRR